MTAELLKDAMVLNSIVNLSDIGPAGVIYRYGITLDTLQEDDPFAADLLSLTPSQAIAIFRRRWHEWNLDKIEDTHLAYDVFTFAMVFGISPAAWLLAEAIRFPEIGKGYAMIQPPPGQEITPALLARLSKCGHTTSLLANFRMLTAGYIGWVHRVQR